MRAPWRTAIAAACDLGAGSVVPRLVKRWPSAPVATTDAVLRACRGSGGMPVTTSAERLFDAAAALLGVLDENSFDGEAAAVLERAAVAGGPAKDLYSAAIDAKRTPILLDTKPVLGAVLDDSLRGADVSEAAARFHAAIVELLVQGTTEASKRTGVRTVAISGSLARNRLILRALPERLSAAGLTVLTHSAVPCDDGGIAVGQAWAGILSRRK